MKLTNKEINYILGLQKRKTDWMIEGTLDETDSGYGYHLTIYLTKPVYYIVRPLLTPFVFIYLVLKGGVKEAKEELESLCGRDIVHFHFHVNESTKENYERAKFIKKAKEK